MQTISIHAPREGGDAGGGAALAGRSYFNPRPPRGGRPPSTMQMPCPRAFQSTPPARGATRQNEKHGPQQPISIHAPREGGDVLLLSLG